MLHVGREYIPLRNTPSAVKVEYLECRTLGALCTLSSSSSSSSLDGSLDTLSPLTTSIAIARKYHPSFFPSESKISIDEHALVTPL